MGTQIIVIHHPESADFGRLRRFQAGIIVIAYQFIFQPGSFVCIKWLDENEIIFDKYDDTVVRRLVDTIRVNSDETITVYLKGGIEVTESLSKGLCS